MLLTLLMRKIRGELSWEQLTSALKIFIFSFCFLTQSLDNINHSYQMQIFTYIIFSLIAFRSQEINVILSENYSLEYLKTKKSGSHVIGSFGGGNIFD